MMDHGQNGAILLETLLKNNIVMNNTKKNLILYNRQLLYNNILKFLRGQQIILLFQAAKS